MVSTLNKSLAMNKKTYLMWVVAIVIVIAISFIPALFSRYVVYVATLALLYAMLTASYDLIFGYTGQLSFAQGAFFGLGAYTSALLTLLAGLNFWLAFPITIIIGFIVAVLVGAPALRLRGSYFAVTTFFLAHFVYLVFLNTNEITGGPMGLRGIQPPPKLWIIDFSQQNVYFYFILFFAILVLLFLYSLIYKTEIGRRFVAIREDQDLAESLGVDTAFYKVLSFSISGALAALTGSLFAHFFLLLHPSQFVWFTSEMIVIMTLVGGAGTLIGPVLGAAVVTFVLELFRYAPELRFIIWAAALIAILVYEPKGLMGIAKRISFRRSR
ncbi:MAG: branched-chain amino acid ABC transporter permease [Bacillota bacterium]|nr:branched-chain amino acid ABC transporter permease [Bacillota bacterium]